MRSFELRSDMPWFQFYRHRLGCSGGARDMMRRREDVEEMRGACQGRLLNKDEGTGEAKRPVWKLPGFISGLVIDWCQDLILSFPICLTRAPLEFSPSSGCLGGSVDSAPGAFSRSVSVCFFSLKAAKPSLERILICGLKINLLTF